METTPTAAQRQQRTQQHKYEDEPGWSRPTAHSTGDARKRS